MPCVTYSMSFDPALTYRQWYPSQREIVQYLHNIASRFQINERLTLNAEVVSARWDDATQMWLVAYKLGQTGEIVEQQSKILVSAIGQLVEPTYGGVQGLEKFKGDILHCNQWNSDTNLAGKQVVVVGNGGKQASSVMKDC